MTNLRNIDNLVPVSNDDNLIILFLYSNDLFDNDKCQRILIHHEVLTNFTKIF